MTRKARLAVATLLLSVAGVLAAGCSTGLVVGAYETADGGDAGTDASLWIVPSPADFGCVTTGTTTPRTVTFTIRNELTAQIGPLRHEVTPDSVGYAVFATSCDVSLKSKSVCSVTISWLPSMCSGATREECVTRTSALLTIADMMDSTRSISVSLNGLGPSCI